jgi:beta-lactamase regulating signal transducer with metallopeptidase domain
MSGGSLASSLLASRSAIAAAATPSLLMPWILSGKKQPGSRSKCVREREKAEPQMRNQAAWCSSAVLVVVVEGGANPAASRRQRSRGWGRAGYLVD